MHPELFEIPFTQLTVKSYGLMMVIAFLAAIFLMKIPQGFFWRKKVNALVHTLDRIRKRKGYFFLHFTSSDLEP